MIDLKHLTFTSFGTRFERGTILVDGIFTKIIEESTFMINDNTFRSYHWRTLTQDYTGQHFELIQFRKIEFLRLVYNIFSDSNFYEINHKLLDK
jgi:hypothetical protein